MKTKAEQRLYTYFSRINKIASQKNKKQRLSRLDSCFNLKRKAFSNIIGVSLITVYNVKKTIDMVNSSDKFLRSEIETSVMPLRLKQQRNQRLS